ncbi:MAG: alpha/beta hydrolase [Burkholderiales bacterium]|nr:alpha/beta hydrolase [Bacteroidia bacterium]
MVKFYIFISCLLLCSQLLSQKSKRSGPYCNWANVQLNKNYSPAADDTCLFVASIRNYDETKEEFVNYDYDTTGTLKYFAIYFKGNSWVAVPYSSLTKLLELKNSFKNFVILTEGLGKTFTSGIDRATKLMRTYNVDELFFDWPTDRPYMRSSKNIKVTTYLAPKAAKAYAVFLKDFEVYKNSHSEKFKSVTLFFHSMGNLLLMYNLKNNALSSVSPSLINSVVLNAACVNQTHHKEWLDKLSFTDHIYITINDKDINLRLASIIFRAHQLGEKPKAVFCEKANYINFSKVLDKEHNYYIMQPLLTEKSFFEKFYEDIFEGKKPEKDYPETLNKKSKTN